ncbi:7-cyano-7-deazaguanine synthase [Vibrio sp. VPAP30]|uniref:7-cyano-7-deazaguanine synthase n=1 Tax=Vibrio sp. VPAP30 TaxID=1647102 RepID=UPI001910EFAC|nr:7-cyano-7-deazaguanine synthase [Vibrio sp. VPAP30]
MLNSVLLLSGGLDSIAIAAWKRPRYGLTINYGQITAQAEINASSQVASELGIEHVVLDVGLSSLGSGAMAEDHSESVSNNAEFWPFRNQMLITIASMFATKKGCDEVLIGTVSTDSRHRDGTGHFLDSIDELIAYQEGGIRVSAPAKCLTTAELVQISKVSMETLSWGHSCHTGNLACGHCPGCLQHSEVMAKLGIER